MSRINIGKADDYIEEADAATTWNIELGTYNLSNAVKGVEFEDAISQPGNFTLDLVLDPGEINGGDRLLIDKEGVGAFKGIVTKPERSSQRDDTIKGGGAAELVRDIPINFEKIDTNTQDIVNTVFSQLDTTDIQVGENEELSDGNGNVSVRAKDEGALSVLNRTVLSHGGEWYVSYNGSNFEFNVVNKLESASVEKTFADEDIREVRDSKVVDEEYDGVIVKGYGDGDDQIVGEYPARNNWPSDPQILRYTDKTILSQEEADSTAESVYNEHTEWRNIYLYPANDNELLSLGDQVTIDDSGTGINNTFRVVHRKFTVDYGDGEGIEYVLSDRPVGIIDKAEDVKDQTDSQTDYMQGGPNTINESNKDLADSSTANKLEFNIPKRFTESISGDDKTAQVRLDYVVDDYQKAFQASDTTAIDDSTKLVKTEVNDFGDVESQYTVSDQFADSDYTEKTTIGQDDNVGGASAETLGYTVDTGYTVGSTLSVPSSPEIEGIYISVGLLSDETPNSRDVYGIRTDINGDGNTEPVMFFEDDDDAGEFLDYDIMVPGTEGGTVESQFVEFLADIDGGLVYPNEGEGAGYAQAPIRKPVSMGVHGNATVDFDIFIPGDKSGEDINLSFNHVDFGVDGDANGEDWTGFYTWYTIDSVKVPDASEGPDNVNAYIEKPGGDNFDAGVNGDQSEESLPDGNTTTFGKLDSNDVVLQDQTTEATNLTIRVNGTELPDSPYSLSGSKPFKNDDIEVPLSDLNTPGENTIELEPDSKALVKGNVIVDHKLESNRG